GDVVQARPTGVGEDALDGLPRSAGHGRLHDQSVAVIVRHRGDYLLYGRQVGVARVRGRRTHRHEQKASVLERTGELAGEVQAGAVAGQQLGESRLVDRHLTRLQAQDALDIDVHAPHLAAEL